MGGAVVFMDPPFKTLSEWTDEFLKKPIANPHKIPIALIPAVTEKRSTLSLRAAKASGKRIEAQSISDFTA